MSEEKKSEFQVQMETILGEVAAAKVVVLFKGKDALGKLARANPAKLAKILGCEPDLAEAVIEYAQIMSNVEATSAVPAEPTEPKAEEKAEAESLGAQIGANPAMLLAFASGQLGEIDLRDLLGQSTLAVVQGYKPAKRRSLYHAIMAQIERRYGAIICIDPLSGQINAEATAAYIDALEAGYPAERSRMHAYKGSNYTLIAVGVDPTAAADEDPLMPGQALQPDGTGVSQINWTGVPLSVRQLVHIQARSGDFDDAWFVDLLDETKDEQMLLKKLARRYPQAYARFGDMTRRGTLPSMKVSLGGPAGSQPPFPVGATSQPTAPAPRPSAWTKSSSGGGRLSPYEGGLEALGVLERVLGSSYPGLAALAFRLRENIVKSKLCGDTASRRAERAEIIVSLNDFVKETGLPASFGDIENGARPIPEGAPRGGLEDFLRGAANRSDEVVLLSSRLAHVRNEVRRGTMTRDQWQVELTRITSAAMELAERLGMQDSYDFSH